VKSEINTDDNSWGELITDLQSRVAFQEDTLQQLNQVIVRQENTIARLQQHVQILAGKVKELGGVLEEKTNDFSGQRPPHY
jgi:SlyX protein